MHTFNGMRWERPGSTVRMKCPAIGNPSPSIVWTKDGDDRPIVRESGIVQHKSRSFAIVLADLVAADSGNYTCTVCNGHGCITFTTRLLVTGKCCRRSGKAAETILINI